MEQEKWQEELQWLTCHQDALLLLLHFNSQRPFLETRKWWGSDQGFKEGTAYGDLHVCGLKGNLSKK